MEKENETHGKLGRLHGHVCLPIVEVESVQERTAHKEAVPAHYLACRWLRRQPSSAKLSTKVRRNLPLRSHSAKVQSVRPIGPKPTNVCCNRSSPVEASYFPVRDRAAPPHLPVAGSDPAL